MPIIRKIEKMIDHRKIVPLIPREISGNKTGCDMSFEEKENSYSIIRDYIADKTQGIATETAGERLKRDGVVRLGHVINEKQALKELFQHPIYNGHVKSYSDQIPITDYRSRQLPNKIYSWDVADLFKCESILKLASSPLLIDFVTNYLGCLPTCYSMNCMLSSGTSHHGTTVRHRDQDDFKFVCLFVYLNDVDISNGPHIYERGSHLQGGIVSAAAPEEILIGKAGEGFIADTWGYHRGLPLSAGKGRICLWIRYGLYDNWTSRDCDKNFDTKVDLSHIDMNDEINRYVFRFFQQGQ